MRRRDAVARARKEVSRVVKVQPQDEDECVDDANFRMIVLVGTDLGEKFAVNPRTLVHLHIGHAALVDETQEPLGEGFFRLVEFAFKTREDPVQPNARTWKSDAAYERLFMHTGIARKAVTLALALEGTRYGTRQLTLCFLDDVGGTLQMRGNIAANPFKEVGGWSLMRR